MIDLAARVVVTTNDWPGLRSLYHRAYEVGLSWTVRRLQSVPGVLAVMLRVGDEGRDWVAGLSDYDLTVLTDRIEDARMPAFLGHLWCRYRSIKRAVPPLGEMEVMTLEEYEDFLRFGPMPTASLKHAEPLFVRSNRPDVNRALQMSPRVCEEREFLRDALTRYLRFLIPTWLQYTGAPSNMARRRADHRVANVGKRLRRLGESPNDAREEVVDNVSGIFHRLTRVCERLEPGEQEPGVVVPQAPSSAAAEAAHLFGPRCLQALHKTNMVSCSVVLWVSYMSRDRLSLAFVVPDRIPEHALRNLLVEVGALHQETERVWNRPCANGDLRSYFPSLSYPVILSQSMWKCWRELSPFDGAAIAASGRVLAGPDGLLEPPTRTALKRGAEIQFASSLPLKNNWRPSGGVPSSTLYGAMVNHVRGYASALSGPVTTAAAASEFGSVEDGYRAVSNELGALRARLEQ